MCYEPWQKRIQNANVTLLDGFDSGSCFVLLFLLVCTSLMTLTLFKSIKELYSCILNVSKQCFCLCSSFFLLGVGMVEGWTGVGGNQLGLNVCMFFT